MKRTILKRKLDPGVSPEAKFVPAQNTGFIMKWGKKTGEIGLSPMKTYVTNPKTKKTTQDEDNTPSLKKLTRMQVISCFIQLEEKSYIECPKKGCRCIGMTIFEIADHMEFCEGAKSNDMLNLCKYCPHGTLTTESLFNHIVVSHPYANDVTPKECLQHYDSVYDPIKTKYMVCVDFKQTIKNHWRIYLESKGCIVCLNPYCHYVTGFISKMESHFLKCGPEVWDKLMISCDKCVGRTSSKEELDAHVAECHSSVITYNSADDKLKEFWESTLEAFEVSKCVVKNCKFISHNLISLEKHYRYCRNPHKDNFEVCALCDGWFDNAYDLRLHQTQFHVLGKANKIKKLRSINVDSPALWSSRKKVNQPTPFPADTTSPVSKECRNLQIKDVVSKESSFLGELSKAIESESKNSSFVDVRITVENQFSWALKAPDVNTATKVVTRRLPCYSVKRMLAESIENGARLLKLSENVASITNNSEKTYIPPRPLDFVLDNPKIFSSLQKRLIPPKPVVPQVTSDSFSVQDGKSNKTKGISCDQIDSSVDGSKKKENCVEESKNKKKSAEESKNKKKSAKSSQKKERKPRPTAKKSKCDNKHISPNPVETEIPEELNPLDPVKVTKFYSAKRPYVVSRTSVVNKADGSNKLANCAVASNGPNSPNSRLVLDPKSRNPSGTYVLANNSGDSLLAIRRNWNKLVQMKTNPHAPQQYPSAKSRVTPSLHSSVLDSFLSQPVEKRQIPSSFRLVKLIPSNKPNDVKPIAQYPPLQAPESVVKTPKYSSPDNVGKIPGVEGSNNKSSIVTAVKNEYSLNKCEMNECSTSNSSIPFQLPIFPPSKSIIFGVSNPISDYYDGMTSLEPPANAIKSENRSHYPRTYGKNTNSPQVSKNHLVVENGMVCGNDSSHVHVKSGIFIDDVDFDLKSGIFIDDVDFDLHHGECIEDPLNIAINNAELEVKTEPMENLEDFEHDDSSIMFHENYDIFAILGEKAEDASSFPYDKSIPFDIICESSQAISGGLYNDRCPWEQANVKTSSHRNSNNLPNKNPYRSKKLLESSICDQHSPSKLCVNKDEVALSGDNLDMLNHIADIEKSDDPKDFKELTNYLTNVNGTHFVSEPMIYTIDNIIYDNPPKLADLGLNRSKARCSMVIPHVQSCSLGEEERSWGGSNKLNKPPRFISRYDRDEIGNMKEFQDLVHYLTNYKRSHFLNQPMVYAVDRIIHDNPPAVSDLRKNGTESKKAVSLPGTPGCSRNSPSEQSVGHSDQAGQPIDLSKPVGKASEEVRRFPTSKRKRKSHTKCLEPDKVEPSLKEIVVPNVGGLVIDDNPEESVCSVASTSTGQEKSLSKDPNNVPSESSNSERLEKPDHSEDTTVSSKIIGGRRTARKSAKIVDYATMQTSDANMYGELGKFESLSPTPIRKKRPSRKVIKVPSVEEIAPGVIVPSSEGESEEVKLPKKKGRPPKRKSKPILCGLNVPRSAFSGEAGPQSSTPERDLSYLGDNDPENDWLVPADRRIIFSSTLVDPQKLVECAVCDESMTAEVYKNEHVIKHNHLCWLKGEEPMDLEDEKGVERFLYRVYLKTRAPFVCEICNVSKKSALGFLSHRKFCGKSVQERKELMVSCSICSRVLLPSSLHNHMIKSHPAFASTPEELPLEVRQAASKCLDTLSTTARDIRDDQEFIDDNEELTAVEKDTWIRQAYAFCKRRIQREQKSIIEAAAHGSRKFTCIISGCNFSESNIVNVIEHCRVCDKEPLDSKCKECGFMTNSETRMINHVRMTHFEKAKEYSSKERSYEGVDVSDVTGEFIPYIKSGELGCRSMLYLQPALYWTRDLRAEHLSLDPLFTDLKVAEKLDVKTVDELSLYLSLKDESIRIKADEDTCEWSVLQKFASESFTDDVRILYTGGVVRCFDWFPSSGSQYLAVGVGSFESGSISALPVFSGPGHFQIWSVGTLDNLSETYRVDLQFNAAICHEFGEIWDLECCPSGGQTDERLGLVAIATSSGIVAVYSIPFHVTSYKERAVKLDPVMILELGISESFQVSKISWSKTKPHRFIAAGFTNGLVAVWDITTSSTLLRSGNTLLPFKSFHPHLTVITALSFSPVNEYYIATGCTEKSSKFWNLHDTSVNHGEFTRGLVTDVAWLPLWLGAVHALDDNYTTGTTTVLLTSIRNFIYQPQPTVTQADSTGRSISVNNWLNTLVCGYDSGQIVLSIARKYIQHMNDDRRKVFNCLLSPQLHDFDPDSSKIIGCKSYSATCERFGVIFNHNFHMNNQTKIKGNPCNDLPYFPLTPVNKVCWNPNPNSFLTLASGFHSGFIIVSRVKLPTNETKLLKNIVESFNNQVPS